MVKFLYVNGSFDSGFALDPALLDLDTMSFQQNPTIQGLAAGKMITVDTNGYVTLAEGGTSKALGVLINDAAGYTFENVPALASGYTPAAQGGGLLETDMVIEDNITPGTPLYCATGADAGMWTSTDPGGADVVGIARSANSTADKTLKIQFYV